MRVYTTIGDIFSVDVSENNKQFFQLVAYDKSQLNTDVIRVFNKVYPKESNLTLGEIANDTSAFFTHCVTKLGVKLKLWEKVGNFKNVGDPSKIIFRDTSDYGLWVNGEPIKISEKWYIWKINQNFKDVGKLVGENRNSEIGIVVNPYDVIERMKTGKFSFFYPDFE